MTDGTAGGTRALDVLALAVVAFTTLGTLALLTGPAGVKFARWVLVAILLTALAAVGQENRWFVRRRKSRPR